MAVENNVTVNSSRGADGNSYTTSVANDELTNNDFLRLMLEQLKMQDPTKPMDSEQMLTTQMQMSSINTNLETIKTMQYLADSFKQSNISNAATIIGKNIEDGNVGDNGVTKAYTVNSVETVDGEVILKARQILYIEDQVRDKDGNYVFYDVKGQILDENGKPTGKKVALEDPGRVIIDKDGNPVILDENNEIIEDSGYTVDGSTMPVYSDQLSAIPFSQVTKIF
ncbi:flagellar biosynthesis protein FlgD [Arcobacter sp. CECT 8983]|uniref:flagellar hook assembly protein FlgD n=1 Tax=Arcobacter sp. CECT 8983 TaxID=2044508 RepID=UPI00100A646B|nr:flagellar hook capping FlgD N-terminal domain-containing protein [Arcobacter sp. CECT 8983]RXJ90204.1 flagellar biosynthesis protein FlgD [Arcobacter sp. CECT 8983]